MNLLVVREPPMQLAVDATVERLGAFIVFHSRGEPAEVPDSISIIGGAPDGEPQPMHYFDSRGVQRLFLTAVEGSTWKIWRAPGEDWNDRCNPRASTGWPTPGSVSWSAADGRAVVALSELGRRRSK